MTDLDQRPRVRTAPRSNAANLAGAALAGVSASVLVFGTIANLSGPIGFVVVTFLFFLVVYAVLTSLDHDGLAVRDAVMSVLLAAAAGLAMLGLGAVIFFTFVRGWRALHHANFYTQDMSQASGKDPLTVGGMGHALVGTVWEIGIATTLSVPIGIACAVYICETRSRSARAVRTIVQAMTALPTILAGLFVYATWILSFGQEKSGLAAALALTVSMLPWIIRSADLVLRLVPNNLREAAAALGAPRWRTALYVVLPTARSGLATSVVLGVARSIGEASPLLVTAGYGFYMNANPLHGPMVSLPLLALKLVASGSQNNIARGFGTAAFLLVLIFVLFIAARLIGGRGAALRSPRQQRRAARDSARDLERISALPDSSGANP